MIKMKKGTKHLRIKARMTLASEIKKWVVELLNIQSS